MIAKLNNYQSNEILFLWKALSL